MAVTREMLVTYGSQAIPGTVAGANVTLPKIHKLRKGPERFEVEFDILIDGVGSSATLAAAVLALEITFTTRRLALTVDLNGTNALTLDDSTRSAADVTPSIEKVGDEEPPDRFDTNTSRLYRVRIEGGLPSLGTTNRLRFGFDVDFSSSRRTEVTFSGTFTATSGGAASSVNYLALIDARVATELSTLGGAFEKTKERYSPDDVDGFTTFEQVHKEILFNQSTGTLNNPAIVDPNLLIARREDSDEGTGDGTPLQTIEARYDTSVDVTVNSDLINVWETISLPLIAQQMQVVAGSGVAITQLSPQFDFYRHTISAIVIGQAVGAGSVITKSVETLDEVDYGRILREVWPRADETPDDEESENPTPGRSHLYQAARVISRTVTTVTEEVTAQIEGNPVGANRNNRVGQQEDVVVDGGVVGDATFTSVRMTRSTRSKRKDRGISTEGIVIPVLERTVIETFRIIVEIVSAESTQEEGGGAPGIGGSPNNAGAGGRR